MPLRSPEIVGMTDPRDLTRPPQSAPKSVRASGKGLEGAQADTQTNTGLEGTPDSALNRKGGPSRPRKKPAGAANSSAHRLASPRGAPTEQPPGENRADFTPVPADEERAFVQILVPPVLAVRIGRASYYLKYEIYKARFQQTIMGALIDRSIPDLGDPVVVSAMATMIARWRRDPLSEQRASRRLGWHLPLPISARLDGLVLNLKEQHYRLRPSATALASALIWFELDPDTPEGQAALRELVMRHYDKYERPDYSLAAA